MTTCGAGSPLAIAFAWIDSYKLTYSTQTERHTNTKTRQPGSPTFTMGCLHSLEA